MRSGLPLEIGEAVQILEENGGKSLVFDYFDRDNLERMFDNAWPPSSKFLVLDSLFDQKICLSLTNIF